MATIAPASGNHLSERHLAIDALDEGIARLPGRGRGM